MPSSFPYLVAALLLVLGWNESFKSRCDKLTNGEVVSALNPTATPVPTPAATPTPRPTPTPFKSLPLNPIKLLPDSH